MKYFGVVHSRFWHWAQEKDLTEVERTIALYIMTNEHGNSLGCYRLPMAYVAEDTGYPIDTVSIGYFGLQKKSFFTFCKQTKMLLIRKFLKWNPPQNPKHAKNILQIAANVPKKCQLSEDIIEALVQYGGKWISYKAIDTLYHTLSIPYTIPYRKPIDILDTYTYTNKNLAGGARARDPLNRKKNAKKTDFELPSGKALKSENPWLNISAWNDFTAYRQEIDRPLTSQAAVKKNLNILAGNSAKDQQAIVDDTIARGWAGLMRKQRKTTKPKDNATQTAELVKAIRERKEKLERDGKTQLPTIPGHH